MATQSPSTSEVAPAESPRTVTTTRGSTLAYETYGRPGGTPTVFLHGTPGSRLLGALLDDEARDAAVQVLAPDRPGYGRSALPDDFAYADVAAALGPLLGERGVDDAALVAFSGGAPDALAAAATMPDRVRSVDVVSGAAPAAYLPAQPAVHRWLGRLADWTPRVLAGSYRLQAALARRRSPGGLVDLYTTADGPVDVPEPVATLVRDDFCEAFARTAAGAVRDHRLVTGDWGVALDRIDCPVRFWHGTADDLAPVEGARALADDLPTATLRAYEGHGHLGTLLAAREELLARVAD